jgi:hypothetical protein
MECTTHETLLVLAETVDCIWNKIQGATFDMNVLKVYLRRMLNGHDSKHPIGHTCSNPIRQIRQYDVPVQDWLEQLDSFYSLPVEDPQNIRHVLVRPYHMIKKVIPSYLVPFESRKVNKHLWADWQRGGPIINQLYIKVCRPLNAHSNLTDPISFLKEESLIAQVFFETLLSDRFQTLEDFEKKFSNKLFLLCKHQVYDGSNYRTLESLYDNVKSHDTNIINCVCGLYILNHINVNMSSFYTILFDVIDFSLHTIDAYGLCICLFLKFMLTNQDSGKAFIHLWRNKLTQTDKKFQCKFSNTLYYDPFKKGRVYPKLWTHKSILQKINTRKNIF